MKTKKQDELVASFLSMLDDETRPLYQGLIKCLSEHGYHPGKEKSSLSFKHDLHNKQIVKMGLKKNHEPFFALRFSACRGYSQKIDGIISQYVAKYPTRAARCVNNGCNYCSGEPETHVYTCISPDGECKTHCGAYAVEIPGITSEDMEEIKHLIKEENEYLLKHEANQI